MSDLKLLALFAATLVSIGLTGCSTLPSEPGNHVSCMPIESNLPWGAISGLTADRHHRNRLYAVHDHNLKPPEILRLEISSTGAAITRSIPITRNQHRVKYDLEGITQRREGGFWLASEGKPGQHRPNLIVRTDAQGKVLEEIHLPPELERYRVKAGFEGIASSGKEQDEQVVVVFQRPWKDDPKGQVKIGQYWPSSGQWRFYRYPLDAPKGTGLSAITPLGGGNFAVLERDNRPFFKAKTKIIHKIHLPPLTDTVSPQRYPLLEKQVLTNILPVYPLSCGTSGKLEGMTSGDDGEFFLIADDDGDGDALLLRVY